MLLKPSVFLRGRIETQQNCAKGAPFLGGDQIFGSEPLQGAIGCGTEGSGQFDKLGIGHRLDSYSWRFFPTPVVLDFCEKAKHDREELTKSSAARKDRFSSEKC